MINELYYRGSGTYQLAVQYQLSRLQNSNVMLRDSMRDMEYGIRSDIRQSTFAIVASQQMLAETFQHGFNSVNNTLEIGFDRMAEQMAYIADSINAMSEKICSKLDEIHDIVNNPLLTQSRELYRRALTNYEKGYYEEALEDIKAAVEKNKTDYISWYLLGQIYLFGAGKFSNVINLDEAENAFFNAVKYIDADIGHSEEANKLASEIYYYLGYTRLVKSNDMLVENKVDESNKKLIEAENASGRAYQICKENILAGYEYAKELHFLGKDDEALNVLEAVIKTEGTFAIKASNDKNFESMWDKIDVLIEKLRDEVADEAKAMVNTIIGTAEKKIDSIKSKVNKINFLDKDEFDKFAEYIDWDILDEEMEDEVERFKREIKNSQEWFDTSSDEAAAMMLDEARRKLHEAEKNPGKNSEIKSVYLDFKNNGVTYISKDDFSNVCNECLSSLKSDLLKYEQLESEDYFSAVKLYDELNHKDSSEHLVDNVLSPVSKLYSKMKLLYSTLIKTAKESYHFHKQNIEDNKKDDKKNNKAGVILAILAIGSLFPAVVNILNNSIGAGFWILVGSVAFGMFAATCALYIQEGISRIFVRIYIISLGVFSMVMIVLGHPWFVIIGAVITFFGTTFWNGEERPY